MAKWIGRQQHVGIARETSRGTLVAPAIWVPKVNFNVDDKVQKAVFGGSYGRLEGGDDAIKTLEWAEGDMEMEATDKTIGLLLYALLGSCSSASFLSAYKHTLSVQQSVQPTTLSLFMKDQYGSVDLAFAMAMVNSMEIGIELGDLVKVATNFIAKRHSDYTAQSATYTAENKFAHHHAAVRIGAAEANLDAAARLNVQSFSMSIERNAIREHSLGTVQPVDILARSLRVTGKLKLTYEDRTYRNYMLDGTTKALRLHLNRSDVTIGSTTPQVQIDLAKVHFFDWQPSQEAGEVAMQEVQFEALYDVSNSRLFGSNTFVVNSNASY